MHVVPLLHIKDDRPLVGRPGAFEPAPTPYPDGGSELQGLTRHLGVRFGDVALVDFGTGRADEPHLNLYQKLSKQNVPLWIDAFPQTLEDVMDLFVAGAERVTVRVDRFDMDDLAEVLLMAEGEIWLGFPYADRAGLERLVRRTGVGRHLEEGASGIVLIDVANTGVRGAPTMDLLDLFPDDVPVYLAGGIQDTAQLEDLDADRVAGVFVDSGLFTDLSGWADVAQEGREDGPRVVGTTSSSVSVKQRGSFLPGVIPGPPPIPRTEHDPPGGDRP